MKICIIGTTGVPSSYGGFETLAENLIEDQSAEFYVYCSSRHFSDRLDCHKGAKLIYIPLKANGWSSIFYDIFSMSHALCSGHKNFLILGISGAIFFPILKLFPKIKIITNVDGIEWKRDKWRGIAKMFLKFSEYLAVKFSNIIISDNKEIENYFLEKYNHKSVTIAYGGDHALKPSMNYEPIKLEDGPFALSICRIEPENNIHTILGAFSNNRYPIIIIGNWNGNNYAKKLYSKYNNNKNMTLLNPIYSFTDLYKYRVACSVYIHGHSSGGTNPSLVEMMHFSKPIIAFDCSFNRASMENKGDYFDCETKLSKLVNNIENLCDGSILCEIAQRRYNWDIVRKQYLEVFEL